MAMTGVLRPGHAAVRVLDLDESVKFYTDVLGLKETGRDKSGRVYFKCNEERDHNSFVIRKADKAGIDYFAFKVLDKATLGWLENRLKEYGVATERVPAGEMLGTGERVRFEIPTGHMIELYAEKDEVGNGLGLVTQRHGWRTSAASTRFAWTIASSTARTSMATGSCSSKCSASVWSSACCWKTVRPISPLGCLARTRRTTSPWCATLSRASCTM